MKTGDTILVFIGSGDVRKLVLDDRVLPDRTCGQYDSGWWAFSPDTLDDPDAPAWFVSEDGSVYDAQNENVGSVLTPKPASQFEQDHSKVFTPWVDGLGELRS